MVSGSLSLPSRGPFPPFLHSTMALSCVTEGVFSLTGWSPARSHNGFHGALGGAPCILLLLARLSCTGPSPSRAVLSQNHSTRRTRQSCSPNSSVAHAHLGSGSSAFARRYLRNHMLFSLPPATQMFQFTGFPSTAYGLGCGYLRFSQVGFPIQRSPDQWIFAPPRSFSQLITSFIGS